MNVTVVVPPALRLFVANKRQIELGVPITADVADVLQSLMVLYPKLTALQADERQGERRHLQLLLDEPTSEAIATGRTGLKEGKTLLLAGCLPRTPGAEHMGAAEG
jgi:hypothetical protein